MKYRAVRASWGFQGRLWREGDEVELPAGQAPNRHFESAEAEGLDPDPVPAAAPEAKRRPRRR